MASTSVTQNPKPTTAKSKYTPIITQPRNISRTHDVFTPEKHLVFKEMPNVHTMKSLGFPDTIGISPIAVSEPFPLFSEEAILRMRQEILTPEVFDNCQYSSNLAHCYLRGFATKYTPFIYDVWKNPTTLAIISQIAGIDLVPALDIEIAHINISVKSAEEAKEQLEVLSTNPGYHPDNEGIARRPLQDDRPIVDWHTDSYPFVCVTMLSDCTDMIGGETALRIGNGDVMKVRGPQMGCAVVLQGRYIEHQALQTLGASERITMVTSFRPRNPLVRDDTVLTTVRPISNINELYNQFTEYRLEMLEERIRLKLKEIRDLSKTGRYVSTKKLRAFLEEQEKFLAHMNKEIVDDEDVVVGNIQQDHISQKPRKRKRRV